MKKLILNLSLSFIVFSFSCIDEKKLDDKVIERLDNVKLDSLKGISVYYRSKGKTENSDLYLISKNNLNCSPYGVEVNPVDNSIMKINRELVFKSCSADYFSDLKIKEIISKYLKLKVSFLKVDSLGNIYVNPASPEKPSIIKIVNKKNYEVSLNDYLLYKGDWYKIKK